MRLPISYIILVFSLFILSVPQFIHAHGGGHEEAKPVVITAPALEQPATIIETVTESSEASLEDSIYGESSDASSETGLGEYDLGEEEPSQLQESSQMMDGMTHTDSHESMDMGGDQHAGHEMEEVELASHEWVSKSQKGYSAAMGITILAGLVFGFLTLKRPFE